MSQRDYDFWFEKGSDVLTHFLAQRYDSFNAAQVVERSFASQGVMVGDARLTGAIDLMEIDKEAKKIIVTDYKTGKSLDNWRGSLDYEKIKLHKYRQQLMMYKLLIENSRDYANYHVSQGVLEFVEADKAGRIQRLELTIEAEELDRFRQLIQAIWKHIMDLDLPDISHYELNYKGVIAFEDDLLSGKI